VTIARGFALLEDGFSLVETLVATVLLFVSVATLAQLFAIAARSNVASRHVTYATVLAGQKLEELRALDLDAVGPSPAAAITADTPGWVDYLDRNGRTIGGVSGLGRPSTCGDGR
jgi:Tfp pilus assembly protein PilV